MKGMYTTNAESTSVKPTKRSIIINGESYEMNQPTLATSCLICGESVFMSHVKDYPKICDECKKSSNENERKTNKGERKMMYESIEETIYRVCKEEGIPLLYGLYYLSLMTH